MALNPLGSRPMFQDVALRWLRYIATFAYIWVYTVGLSPLSDRSAGAYEQFAVVGTAQYAFAYAALALVGFIGLAVHHLRLLRLFDTSLWILLAWMAVTISVSVTPQTAVVDYVKLLAFLLGTATLVMWFRDEQELISCLKIIFLIIVALDVLSVIAVPGLAIHQRNDAVEGNIAGAWRGMHEHKGKFGEVLAIAAILCLYDRPRLAGLMNVGLFIVCIAITFLAMAKTSIGGVFIGLAMAQSLIYISRYSSGPIAAAVLAVPVLGLGLLASFLFPIVMNAFFGDATFTGRTETWAFLLNYSRDRLWMGSGFSSFFIGEAGPLYRSGSEFLKHIGHAHNTYLDMLVTMGVPGAVLAVFTFLIVPVKQNFARLRSSRGARLWITMLMFLHVSGFTVIVYFANARPVGMILIVTYFALRRFRFEPLLSAGTTAAASQPAPEAVSNIPRRLAVARRNAAVQKAANATPSI